MRHRIVEDRFAATPIQQGLLFHAELDPQSHAYLLQQRYRIHGRLDPVALRRAIDQVVARHGILRTAFESDDSRVPEQVVYRGVRAPFQELDLRDLPQDAQQARLQALCDEDLTRGFDLAQPPLLRFLVARTGLERYELLKTTHHAITDGWSSALLMQQIADAYACRVAGRRTPPAPMSSFRPYVEWLREQPATHAHAFFREMLAGITTPTQPQLEAPAGGTKASTSSTGVLAVALDAPTSALLARTLRRHEITQSTLVQGMWAMLLGRYARSARVVFGVTVSGRSAGIEGAETMLGPLLNTLPLRVDLPPDQPLFDWLSALQHKNVELREHEHAALPALRNAVTWKPGAPLFDSIVVFENYARPERANPGAGARGLVIERLSLADATHYGLTLYVQPGPPLGLRLSYNARRFSARAARTVIEHALAVLRRLAHTAHGAPRLDLLGEVPQPWAHALARERATPTPIPREDILTRFEASVRAAPGRRAIVAADATLTYGELERGVNALAQRLVYVGIGCEDRVALCLPRGAHLPLALLSVWRTGAGYVPLSPDDPKRRNEELLRQSGAALLLVDDSQHRAVQSWKLPCPVMSVGGIGEEPRVPQVRHAPPASLAYLIHTSGSTGRPKGVAVAREGLNNFLHSMERSLNPRPGDRWLAVTPLSFDISVLELVLPLVTGGCVVVASEEQTRDGEQLAQLIGRSDPRFLQATPSTWQLLQAAGWKGAPALVALTGGEATPPALARKLLACVETLWNVYGPTETTIWSSAVPFEASGEATICGALANTTLHVLDRQMRPTPPLVEGELFIGGEGLARGYHDDPANTAARFVPDPFAWKPGARLYRTGDRVHRRYDGKIAFLGRMDQQVKLRGHRIELGEIERALSDHPDAAAAALRLSEDGPNGAQLVAFVVPMPGAEFDPEAIRRDLRERLPAVMIPNRIVFLRRLPTNTNGKLDRGALARIAVQPTRPHTSARARGSSDSSDTAAGSPTFAGSPGEPLTCASVAHMAARASTAARYDNPTAALIAGIWRAVLGVDGIGRDTHFFEVGGHSLSGLRVVSRVRSALSIELPVRELFDAPRFVEFVQRVEQRRNERTSVLDPIPGRAQTRSPLSFSQERLWFLHLLEEHRAPYNLSVAVRVRGHLPPHSAEAALAAVTRRHAILRSTIVSTADGPRQVDDPSYSPCLTLLRADGTSKRDLAEAVAGYGARRFDLAREVPLRAGLIRLSDSDQVLVLCVHHIAADGWSLRILVDELWQALAAEIAGEPHPPRPQPLQYADYAQWQRESTGRSLVARQVAYWQAVLADPPPPLALPTDRPRPEVFRFRGGSVPFLLGETLGARLRRVCLDNDVTLFMVLLAAYALLLGRTTGARDLTIGTPVSGRTRPELEDVLGTFVNTLVLRVDLHGNPTFCELLARIRQTALEAFDNQDAPFDQVVSAINPVRSLARTPLFQAMLEVHDGASDGGGPAEVAGIETELMASRTDTSKFDLVLHVEDAAAPRGRLEYNSELFDESTIASWAARLQSILAAATTTPEARLSELAWLPQASRRDLLALGRPRRRHTISDDLGSRFRACASRSRARLALTYLDSHMSYAELDRRSDALAAWLQARGVQPESPVGICLERGFELVVAILAVLKAGGCYVSVDPQAPASRTAFMLRDAGAAITLSTRGAWNASMNGLEPILLDELSLVDAQPTAPPGLCADNLAYSIYTSGSTGLPKGVGITHRQVMRLMVAAQEPFDLSDDQVWTLFHSTTFDFSVWELWGALLYGGRLVIVPDACARDPEAFAKLVVRERVTHLSQTPSAFYSLATHLLARRAELALAAVIFGGESLDTRRLLPWLSILGDAPPRLVNMYGITETTVHVTYQDVRAPDEDAATAHSELPDASVIGRPLDDLEVWVLDPWQTPLPSGVAGEIHVAGDGVGRGYTGRPGLTAERFVPHPHGEPGSRIYRTGDLGMRAPEGTLIHLGRLDSQVQLRGHRIELGEVAAALGAAPAVAAAEVLFRPATDRDRDDAALVAFVVPQDAAAPPATDALRRWLGRRLPSYMLPALFVAVERLPLTPHGKLDRSALLTLAHGSANRPADGAAARPSSRLEQLLADIWSRVLGVPRVDVHDDFFELGGNSLLAVQVMEAVRAEVGGRWPLTALFQAPTVARLASTLAPVAGDAPPVVALNIIDAGVPLTCIHPAGGHLFGYASLAAALASDGIPVEGIASRSVVDPQWRDPSIDEMAIRYAESILQARGERQARAQGVALLGWSLGGVIAMAIAHKLETLAVPLRFVGLVDAPRPGANDRPGDRDLLDRYAGKLGLGRNEPVLRSIARRERETMNRALAAARDEDERLALMLSLGKRHGVLTDNVSLSLCRWVAETLEHANTLLQAHRIRPIAADLHVFVASQERASHVQTPAALWSRYTTGQAVAREVPATHASIIRAPECLQDIRTALRDLDANRNRQSTEEP
ncbi:MAG: amino acid adenylation domain-containing protein [Myxococcales bacterium]|nr:amino acid adenylation domain-containing protein [Myxococcales bacterium]